VSKKKNIVYCILLALLLVVLCFGEETIRVKTNNAKIRIRASIQSQVVATVQKGDTLAVNKKEGEWYSITLPDKKSGFELSGYINQIDIEGVQDQTGNASLAKVSSSDFVSTLGPSVPSGSRRAPDSMRFAKTGKIICSTLDTNYEYDIIDIIAQYQEFKFSFNLRDPLENAIKDGAKKLEERVIKAGGDAVIGLRLQFTSPVGREEGRLLIYGTVIKFR
jgi:uncharacterized protein YbjQ (UPF0145 family)